MKLKTGLSLFLERSMLFFFSAHAKKRRPRRPCGKVLVARTDGIGDYIFWLTAGKEIRALYPDSQIEMLIDDRKPTWELVRCDSTVDSCLALPVVTWRRFVSVLRMCRREYDVILQPVYSRLAFTDILLFAARAGRRITLDTNAQYMTARELKWSNRGYDEILAASPGVRHELVRCAEFVRGLGAEDFRACFPDLDVLGIDGINGAGGTGSGKYVMVFPAASWSAKVWEKEKYAAVIQWLLQKFDGMVYLGGAAEDREICGWIADRVHNPRRVRSLAGETGLVQLAAYIKGACLVVGNDTGAVHIAAAGRVKAVVVTAEREIGRFLPYETEGEDGRDFFPVCIHRGDMECGGCVMRGVARCPYQKNITDVLPCISGIRTGQVIERLETVVREVL